MEKFDLNAYMQNFFKQLPEELQNDEMKASIFQHVIGLISQAVSDYMSLEDLEHFIENPTMNDEKIPEVLGNYIEHHPELSEMILEELRIFEKLILKPVV